uniref:DNA repair protein XRCC4 n=1 Tax=Arcella intermedia TaxID=1963864 RepID=A0A6B2L3M7_9EUKA
MKITDGKYVWTGEAPSEYIEETLKPKGMKFEDYLSLTKEALSSQDLSKKKFTYSIQQGNSASEIKLVWNIKLASETSFAMKGALDLERVQEIRSDIQSILDYLTTTVVSLQTENKDLKKMNSMLTVQRNEAISQFDHITIEKQCMETEMLTKFVDLLNEKKKKIRELKEELKNRPFKKSMGHDSEVEIEKKPSQVQTGESLTLRNTSLTFDNISNPTPTLELLKDDEEKVEPLVRKRFRGPDDARGASPPKLLSYKSHGIITLCADSPAPKQLQKLNTKQHLTIPSPKKALRSKPIDEEELSDRPPSPAKSPSLSPATALANQFPSNSPYGGKQGLKGKKIFRDEDESDEKDSISSLLKESLKGKEKESLKGKEKESLKGKEKEILKGKEKESLKQKSVQSNNLKRKMGEEDKKKEKKKVKVSRKSDQLDTDLLLANMDDD